MIQVTETNNTIQLVQESITKMVFDGAVALDELGAIGDGIADDTPAFQKAFDSGKSLVFGYGKTYRLASNPRWVLQNRSLCIFPNGSEIVLDNPNPQSYGFIYADNSFLEIQSVSSIGIASIDLSGFSQGTTDVNYIDVSDGSKYQKNDIVKIFSDDIRPTSDPVNKAREGEYSTVGLVDGNRVYLCGLLKYAYSTNIRFAKMNVENTINILGDLKFRKGPNCPLNPQIRVMISISGYYNPQMGRLHCADWGHIFVSMNGCYEGCCDYLNVRDFKGDDTENRFAYGGQCLSSHGFTWASVYAQNVRHAITTNEQPLNAGDARVALYGRTYAMKTVYGVANNCSHAPWDTHPDSHKCEFINVFTYVTKRGETGGEQWGAQLRGIEPKIHCLTTNCLGGILFENGGEKGITIRPTVDRLVHRPEKLHTDNYPYSYKIFGTSDSRIEDFYIGEILADIPANPSGSVFGDASYSSGTIGNIHAKIRQTVADGSIFTQTASQIKHKNVTLDLSESTVGGQKIWRITDSASELEVDRIGLIAGSVNWLSAIDFNNGSSSGMIREIWWDRSPSDQDLVTASSNANFSVIPRGGWSVPNFGWKLEDHYLTISLDTLKWLTQIGTDPGCSVAMQNTANGIVRLTFGVNSGGTVALNGAQKTSALRFQPSVAPVRLESWFKTSSISSVNFVIGFADDTSLKIPFTMASSDVVTANCTNAACIVFDTNATTKQVWGVCVKDGVVVKIQLTDSTNNFTAGGKYNWSVEILKNGTVNFYRSSVLLGSIANAVSTTSVLCSYEGGFSRNTTTKYLELDATIIRQGNV